MTITLRQKDLENDNKSLYLDIYENGKRKFEFLSLYLIPEINQETKERNEATLKRAQEIRAERILHPETIPEKIQAKLETKLTGSKDNQVFYDIALKYYDGSKWVDVTEANFPANGVDVVLPYPDGTDSKDTFTIVHMLTTGENAGEMEIISYTKEDDGLHFHVTSLSPFGVSWVKYTAPTGGGGGGVRVKKCVSCFATIDVTMKVRNDEMTIRADSKSKSGILFGYCAKSNGIK